MKLDPRYTSRKALVYMRQSTPGQVRKNVGSKALQRDQRQHAIRLGYPPANIEVVDGDLGKSGTTTLGRHEYERARVRLRTGEIGALFASDMSRLGRKASELLSLIDDCKIFDVIIVLDGRPNDPNDLAQLLSSQVQALFSAFNGAHRTDMMSKARLAKARLGKAVSAPPTGYVARKKRTWHLDPDLRVQESLRAVFRIFAEERSLAKTVRRLQRMGAVIWTRTGADIVARKPVVANVVRILHNPAYKGEYRYPQRKVDRRAGLTAKGYARTRRALPDETVVIPNHHVGYVTPQQWEDNLRILEMNGPKPDRRNVGAGSAMLQGFVRCGLHQEHAMSTRYSAARPDKTRSHRYQCQGDYLAGGRECGCVPGLHLDRAAVAAVLSRLEPPGLLTLKTAWDEARENAINEDQRRRLDCQAAARLVDDAKSRLMSVEPSHRHVAKIYEAELERAVERLHGLELASSREASSVERFNDQTWDELLRLCADLESIWTAATTTNLDRKQILRTMVKSVVVGDRVKRGRRTERLTARIVWADGCTDSVIEVKMLPYAYDLIAELDAAHCDAGEITRRLNAAGLVTNQGNPWTKDTVAHAVRAIRARRQ